MSLDRRLVAALDYDSHVPHEGIMPFSVLLVCTGNTCRSAMAEGILRSLIQDSASGEEGGDSVFVFSAGTAGLTGFPPSDYARGVAREHGVDISEHLSRALTGETIDRADLILAMAEVHVDRILAESPDASGRTFLLSEYAGATADDVPDPMGGSRRDYETVYRMLDAYLRRALPRILDSAGEERA
jgi:protein-tyrosine-phosphatase